MLLEICANSLSSAIAAQQGGAQRIELCENLSIGGTTPSAATIELTRQRLDIPVFVLIRPRGGDFCYDPMDMETMVHDIQWARKAGADGIVSGVLNPDATIDQAMTRIMIEAAKPLEFTFHRAFDWTPDPYTAMETLISLGVNRILTSGQQATALQGSECIAGLIKQAGNRIDIMPGGGINEENILEIARITKATSVHLSARKTQAGRMIPEAGVAFTGPNNYGEKDYDHTDAKRVARFRQLLTNFP